VNRRYLGFVAMLAVACSSENVTVDAGEDAGVGELDASDEPDAGRRGLCPQEANPACMRASECGDEQAPQSNCGGCYPYSRTLCTTGTCQAPETLRVGDPHTVYFNVGVLETNLKSLAGLALATETAGGNPVTCDDVYAGRVDYTNPCYNVLDSRGLSNVAQMGDTYPFLFGQIPANLRVLFVIYAYAVDASQGEPIGVTCTAHDVGPPGVGPTELMGDMMRRL
jgi:hypothetical protein